MHNLTHTYAQINIKPGQLPLKARVCSVKSNTQGVTRKKDVFVHEKEE
jgi:hypothetical protein